MDEKTLNFGRQKFLLWFIRCAGGTLTRLDLQKLLFLYHRATNEKHYDFVPYRFGCYSFQAASDLELLDKKGFIALGEREISLRDQNAAGTEEGIRDVGGIIKFLTEMEGIRGDELIRRVYQKYPYYAVQSEIAGKILNKSDLQRVAEVRERIEAENETILFTIGYEGITFEAYLNQLIRNNVRVLCDVRHNPLSRKFGFSKSILGAVLPKAGMMYVHFPELGIRSEARKNLNGVEDYQSLFSEYESTLSEKTSDVEKVVSLMKEHRRVALTCFEKDPEFCHRHCLGRFLEHKYGLTVRNLYG